MALVPVYTIAASLPDPGWYFILEKHLGQSRCKWSESTAEEFENLHRQIAEGKGVPEGMTTRNASLKVLPYYITFYHPTGRLKKHVHINEFANDILGDAGKEDEADGRRLVMICKGSKPEWNTEFLLDSAPSDILDPDTLEARSNRDFIRAAAQNDKACACDLKLVSVPANEPVRLTRNLRGEYVSQTPKTWS